MKTQHTPGPWTANHLSGHVYEHRTARSILVDYEYSEIEEDERLCNIILAAAAPDLLAALESVAIYFELLPVPVEVEQAARAAIAKAKGEKT